MNEPLLVAIDSEIDEPGWKQKKKKANEYKSLPRVACAVKVRKQRRTHIRGCTNDNIPPGRLGRFIIFHVPL